MTTKSIRCMGLCLSLFLLAEGHLQPAAQQRSNSPILVNVVLVQLNVAVTDHTGKYVTGLHPENFAIMEDKIPETISSFEEGGEPEGGVIDTTQSNSHSTAPANENASRPEEMSSTDAPKQPVIPRPAGANVFILFDTSDFMYRGFVFAQDAITGFVRSMESADQMAFYSYSRDLVRTTALTNDRSQVLSGVRSTVAGDEAALYNCLLLTVRDAAQLHGRKAIVVFSNGPDNASSVPPEDVEELAQSTGTIIYILSTRAAEDDPMSTAVFERMSKATGGKAYFAKSWRDETLAFNSIRDDLAHLYTITYYPKPNGNRGWRTISVKLVGKDLTKDRVRTRDGYQVLQQAAASSNVPSGQESGAGTQLSDHSSTNQ
jgi:Ca-activated chloride channel homolog